MSRSISQQRSITFSSALHTYSFGSRHIGSSQVVHSSVDDGDLFFFQRWMANANPIYISFDRICLWTFGQHSRLHGSRSKPLVGA
jgi:hypothetical protein